MASILITGSSRGIGLELVKQLVSHSSPPATLIATCRDPQGAKDLQALADTHKSIHILKLDVLDFDSLGQLAQKVEEIVGNRGLNVLINNAGILEGRDNTFDDLTPSIMMKSFQTNTIAPVMLIKALRPFLRRAATFNDTLPIGWSRAAIINVSSNLGSLKNNDFGGYWGYRESKAALNMATRSLVQELKQDNILAMVIHPGWVKTAMGTNAAELTVTESVSGMLRVFYSLGPDDQGCFLQWDGKVLPW